MTNSMPVINSPNMTFDAAQMSHFPPPPKDQDVIRLGSGGRRCPPDVVARPETEVKDHEENILKPHCTHHIFESPSSKTLRYRKCQAKQLV